MKVSGEHEFRASRAQIWDALNDPAVLAATLPGERHESRIVRLAVWSVPMIAK